MSLFQTNPNPVRRFLVCAISLICAAVCPVICSAADLSLSLPLGPYYRPGKYLPVRITASITRSDNNWIGLAADNVTSRTDISKGAGRTGIELSQGRVDAVVPWLVVDARAKRPRLFVEQPFEFVDGPPLRKLADSERLVGWTAPDESFARQLLHGPPKLIHIALDPAQPISGSPAAWEMLDAIILDADSAARLSQSQIAGLLACGVTLAVKTATPPFPTWPWKKMGEYSVLQYQPVGPMTAGYHEQAYLPVADWQAGWSWGFRRRILLFASMACVLMLGLTLWRPRLLPIWAILLSVVLLYGIGHWWGLHVAIQQAAGEIIVINQDGLTQTDAWTYQTSVADRTATLRWSDAMRPIFASNAGVDDVWMNLNCTTAGEPSEFAINIPANRKVAFVARTVGPRAPKSTPANPVTSPLKEMAEKLYLPDRGKILGELGGAPASAPAYGIVEIVQWNALVLSR